MEIIGTIIIGAIAGWLAGLIYKGSGLGLLWNIVVGIIGGFWQLSVLEVKSVSVTSTGIERILFHPQQP
ncbi:MAG: GlsB/YeaQ/YmgE family stress response membrane protein [Bacteroidota bacterium]|nr:GlsB/YeaQ/YmgE family stress response membrane protein [Bacteroidota bacterium]